MSAFGWKEEEKNDIVEALNAFIRERGENNQFKTIAEIMEVVTYAIEYGPWPTQDGGNHDNG